MKKYITLLLTVIMTCSIATSAFAATKNTLPMKSHYSEYEYMTTYGCPIYNISGQIVGYCEPGTYLISAVNNGVFIALYHNNQFEFVPTDALVCGDSIYNYLANKDRNIVPYICVCDSQIILVKKFTAKKITGTSIYTGTQMVYDATGLEVYPIFRQPFYGPCN